jgi:membrane protein implicated in regulation of membrane protease activity
MEYWWLLIVVGILLIVAEIFIPGQIVMWFGFAFLVTSIPAWLGASATTLVFCFAISSLFFGVFVRKIALSWMMQDQAVQKTNMDAIINSEGIAVRSIQGYSTSGRVRIGKEIWSAVSTDPEEIKEGDVVKVVRIEGVTVVVIKKGK